MKNQKRATMLRVPTKHFPNVQDGLPSGINDLPPSVHEKISFWAATPKTGTPIEDGLITYGHLTKVKTTTNAGDLKQEKWQQKISRYCIAILYRLQPIMALLGFFIEWTINFLALNEGPVTILRRLWSRKYGTIIIPNPEADNYYSCVGQLDPRVNLSLDGQEGSSEANASTFPNEGVGSRSTADVCIMAAKLAYENKAVIKKVVKENWKMHFVDFYNCWNDYQKMANTQVFLFMDKPKDANMVVVAWRGTEAFNAYDWSTDIDFSWVRFKNGMGVHLGFIEALGLASRDQMVTFNNVEYNADTKHHYAQEQEQEEAKTTHSSPSPHYKTPKEIKDTQKTSGLPDDVINDKTKILAYDDITKIVATLLHDNPNAKLFVTGHSLGGALAILYSTLLYWSGESGITSKLAAVYTFGQPRVGDDDFASYALKNLGQVYYRIVYCNDIVPRVPFDNEVFAYKHFGNCAYFNSVYNGWVLEEAPNRNYFSVWRLLILHINAFWEVLQSMFIMTKKHGANFSESLTSILFRFLGLLAPGLAAHSPCNYVNSVRLGPFPLGERVEGDIADIAEEFDLIKKNIKDIGQVVSSAFPTMPGKAMYDQAQVKLLGAMKS